MQLQVGGDITVGAKELGVAVPPVTLRPGPGL